MVLLSARGGAATTGVARSLFCRLEEDPFLLLVLLLESTLRSIEGMLLRRQGCLYGAAGWSSPMGRRRSRCWRRRWIGG
jgi:hypothetical protein